MDPSLAATNWVAETWQIIFTVGNGLGNVVAAVAETSVGAFLIGVYVVATIVHMVVGKVRNG